MFLPDRKLILVALVILFVMTLYFSSFSAPFKLSKRKVLFSDIPSFVSLFVITRDSGISSLISVQCVYIFLNLLLVAY